MSLQRVTELPANFTEFIDEVATSLQSLYGDEAATHYRASAPSQFQGATRHPSVEMLGWFEGRNALGLLVTVQRGFIAQFSFLHVLKRGAAGPIEQTLVTEAIRTCRAGGVEAILAEYVQFTAMDDKPAYDKAGFTCVERELMTAAAADLAQDGSAPSRSTALHEDDWDRAADVIVRAYENHPGRRLHIEVRDQENARLFLRSAAENNYGTSRPQYHRAIGANGDCDGVIVGCEVAPHIGFILQVAVRPHAQNRGMGETLVREIAQVFTAAGCPRVALGVTLDSPARRLYQRLGFQPLKRVNAFVWWRP